MKKSIHPVDIDPEVLKIVTELEQSFLSPAKKRRLKRQKTKQQLRNGRRAVYDLDPELISQIKRLAASYQTSASQVAMLGLHLFLQQVEFGNVNIGSYCVPIDNPHFKYRIEEFKKF